VSARSACWPREPRNTWAGSLTLDEPRVSSSSESDLFGKLNS
jgi:hypothetical protein